MKERSFLCTVIVMILIGFAGANAKGDAYIANCEPEELAVEDAKQVEIAGSEEISGISKVDPRLVKVETRMLADIREENFWSGEVVVVIAGAQFPPELTLIVALA